MTWRAFACLVVVCVGLAAHCFGVSDRGSIGLSIAACVPVFLTLMIAKAEADFTEEYRRTIKRLQREVEDAVKASLDRETS